MRVLVQNFHKAIYSIGLPKLQEAAIWDFYVTHAIASSASQKRSAKDYGLSQLPWGEMKKVAGLRANDVKILLANSINETLKRYDLIVSEGKGERKVPKAIDIDALRIVCTTPYRIADENPPEAKIGEAESVLTHIRNSFAHGLTYFFDNGNVMFEDKDSSGQITARMILKGQTLLDWIGLIDKEKIYYILHDTKGEE